MELQAIQSEPSYFPHPHYDSASAARLRDSHNSHVSVVERRSSAGNGLLMQGHQSPPTIDSFSEDQIRKSFSDLGVNVSVVQLIFYDAISESLSEVDKMHCANAWAVKVDKSSKYPHRSDKASKSANGNILSAMSLKSTANVEKLWILPFHFDLESVEAIARFCKFSGNDFFNTVNDADIWTHRRQIQFSTFHAEINSSNYYLLHESIFLRLYSLLVSITQVVILVIVVMDLENNVSVQRGGGQAIFVVAFLLPFIAMYISSTMINGLSEQAMSSAVQAYEVIPVRFHSIVFSVLFSALFYAISLPFLMYWGVFKNKIAFCFLIEILLSTLAVAAVSAIVTSQSDLINILFNFTGVLVVLDVDDKIAAWLKYTNMQGHLCYRNDLVKSGWTLKGELAEKTRRRGMGATVGLTFYLFLAIKFIAVDNSPPPSQS